MYYIIAINTINEPRHIINMSLPKIPIIINKLPIINTESESIIHICFTNSIFHIQFF
jgi:hypothetical protein